MRLRKGERCTCDQSKRCWIIKTSVMLSPSANVEPHHGSTHVKPNSSVATVKKNDHILFFESMLFSTLPSLHAYSRHARCVHGNFTSLFQIAAPTARSVRTIKIKDIQNITASCFVSNFSLYWLGNM